MMRTLCWGSGLALTLLLASNASAQDAEAGPDTEKPRASELEEPGEVDDDYGHHMQFGLRAALVAGYRMVFRYDESPYCAEYDLMKPASEQQKFCGHGSPLAVDLGLSFAMLDMLEPFIWARFGLTGEEQTNTNPLIILGAGARFYATADSAFKVYIEPAIGFELEGGAGGEPLYAGFDYKKDVVFHIAAGPQLDFSKNVGVYVDAGLTTGIFRAIHTTLEAKLGVQARFP
jgi:hypothetical protein